MEDGKYELAVDGNPEAREGYISLNVMLKTLSSRLCVVYETLGREADVEDGMVGMNVARL